MSVVKTVKGVAGTIVKIIDESTCWIRLTPEFLNDYINHHPRLKRFCDKVIILPTKKEGIDVNHKKR